MNRAIIDPNLYSQIGLDSGALTMLGAVIHRFEEPGEYRGTVRKGADIENVFYISVDKESPVAAAEIDLAKLAGQEVPEDDSDCCSKQPQNRFSVNPKGYALFRVSAGKGGYSVNVRRADEDERTPVFNSSKLEAGSIFSATILRPGEYSISNQHGKARARAVVTYPPRAFSSYRPPEPQRVEVSKDGFYPDDIKLKPAQGLVFECQEPSRIVIKLEKADDGPNSRRDKNKGKH